MDFADRIAALTCNYPHTPEHRPWEPVVAICLADDAKAAKFEQYLESGSGYAVGNDHFWQAAAPGSPTGKGFNRTPRLLGLESLSVRMDAAPTQRPTMNAITTSVLCQR